jgi:L-gulono-1,4-lactone dehydrogenase
MWRNWAGDQQCVPAAIERPSTIDELKAVVGRAREAGQTVRASASGHSFTDIACTDGRMVRLDRMDRILDVDRESPLVKVEAGIVIRDLSEALYERGLALENLGDIDVQTISGAISTATHGTGERLRNISSQVEALELVTADGTLVECSRESDPELWRAARVGLGSLGVIATLTLRCVPAFTIRRHDHALPLAEVLDRLDELAAANDHFEFYVFPHTDVALCRESKDLDSLPQPRGRVQEYLLETLLENHAFGLLCRLGKLFPSRIPAINRLITKLAGSSVKTDRSYRVFSTRRLVRFTEMEYALPRAAGPEALRRVLEMIERRGFDVPFPIEFRVVAPDDAYLSTAYERQTAYIAVHMFRGMPWEPYFRAVEAIMDDYDGRPHWGKRHFQSAATLAPRYPDWDRFQSVRARLDPDGVFTNEYTDRVLGTQRKQAPSPRYVGSSSTISSPATR